MMDEWLYLIGKYTIAGARSKFEDICASLFKKKFIGNAVKSVKVVVGDGGIDVFIGEIGIRPITVIQCKFFANGIGESQKGQIRDSFKTVLNSTSFQTSKWILCIPDKLSIEEHKWWVGWKRRQTDSHKLPKDYIKLIDGADLIDDLKEVGLYNEVFDEHYKTAIEEIHKQIVDTQKFDLENELLSASVYMKNLKNYFSKFKDAHIYRKETDQILAWAKMDLPGKDPFEKVLVLKGKKGVGKSTILKDAYCQLISENDYLGLALKCDQFYDINLSDLAKQVFIQVDSFTDLISAVQANGKRFVIFLDQLDALSQTLSSDRRWLQTYVKLIYELVKSGNVRIVISTRSFDLEYDADLRRFNDVQHIRHIEVGKVLASEVKDILKLMNIDVKSDLLIDLLTVPYNLELFTKIPDLGGLTNKEGRISLSKLYSELWSQVLSKKELLITDCLNVIVKRMYEQHPNLIDQSYLEDYRAEIDYLVSHNILLKNDTKLSFFHQSFYEYYLARWFVVSNKDLVAYIFEQGQNLYIRSLVKTVIEYLREVDHLKYIDLYKKIMGDDQVRYHIKYLFMVEIGLVEIPTEKEKELICNMLPKELGKLFLDLFNSDGWIEFFISNNLLPGSGDEIYSLLHRNINYRPKLILDYLVNSELEQRENLIIGLIPSIQVWSSELIPFFDRYYSYNDNTELWYFETLKKIALFDLTFVLVKLKPPILASKTKTERIRFDYRFDKIISFLYQLNPKALTEFLFSIHLDLLDSTKHSYYSEYSGIVSDLLSSHNYDNGLFYKDSEDEKSIDFYLLKYYKQCDRKELKELVDNFMNTNYVSLLVLFTKLLRDRANEFVDEIYQLLMIIQAKNGLKAVDDFFQLNIRKLISKSISYFDEDQYIGVKTLLLDITHPYEICLYEEKGKREYKLTMGKKKYLFLKALPDEILLNDIELKKQCQMLERRYGVIDHDKAMDRNHSSGFRAIGSPISKANFEKFNYEAWLKSMRKVDENYKSEDFFKGGLLEHARAFERVVERRPEHYCDLIARLFNEEGVSNNYTSHGISALVTAKYDAVKVAELVIKEIQLPMDNEYTLYVTWHIRYLIDNNQVTDDMVSFLVSIAKSDQYPDDVLNPNDPLFDFINTPRGSAIHNLMYLVDYPKYKDDILSTIDFVLDAKNKPSTTIQCGIMTKIAHLNHLDIEKSFQIFKELILLKNPLILKHSIMPAQYFNNSFHERMGFYFDEMFLHEELYEQCYFFVSSWVFENIDDYPMFDRFIELGERAIKCAVTVAEKFLIVNGEVNSRAMEVLERCLTYEDIDISHELASLVLRKFKIENFNQLINYTRQYISTAHFIKDPRYLLEFLTECSSDYPTECLELLGRMSISDGVDITKKAYMGDEPLVLVLAIYSRLRLEHFRFKNEQQIALDVFDKLLGIPSIRHKALEAMETVLN